MLSLRPSLWLSFPEEPPHSVCTPRILADRCQRFFLGLQKVAKSCILVPAAMMMMVMKLKQGQGFLTSGCFFCTEFSEHNLCGNCQGWADGFGGGRAVEEVVGEHKTVKDSMLKQTSPSDPVLCFQQQLGRSFWKLAGRKCWT